MANDATPPRKRGCFFYGCLTAIVLALVGALLVFFVYRFAKTKLDALVTEYTDTTPVQLEKVTLPPEQLSALQQRTAAFADALQKQTVPVELILSAEDINALINSDPAYKEVKDKLFVMIEGDRITGKVSIPFTDNVGPLKLKGRYLNGTASLKVSLVNGHLNVVIDDLEVNGKQLPAPFLTEMRRHNFAQDVTNQPKAAEALEKFESIQVKDGKVILRNKVSAAPQQ
jgi:hypothetical protein